MAWATAAALAYDFLVQLAKAAAAAAALSRSVEMPAATLLAKAALVPNTASRGPPLTTLAVEEVVRMTASPEALAALVAAAMGCTLTTAASPEQ
jgi:hypothetical protein